MLKIYDPIYSVSIDGGPWKRLGNLSQRKGSYLMGKKNNKDKINFRVTSDFLKAYDITLKKAATSLYKKSDFRCQSFYPVRNSLSCIECPFQRFQLVSHYCTNPSFEKGAGYKRTFEQWQDWFYKLTGVKDDRPKEMFMKKNEQTKESAEHTEQEARIDKRQ